MAEQEEMELISPTNASNMHLHVEQLSQKTDWKLARDLFYNQSCKENFHVTKEDGGKKAFRTGLAHLRGSCKEGKVHMGRTLSWGAPLLAARSDRTDRGAEGVTDVGSWTL